MYHDAGGGVDFTNEVDMHGGQLVSKESYCLHFVQMLTMFRVDGDLEIMCQSR